MEARGLPENEMAGRKGGGIAKKARLELEEKQASELFPGRIICRRNPAKNYPGNNMKEAVRIPR